MGGEGDLKTIMMIKIYLIIVLIILKIIRMYMFSLNFIYLILNCFLEKVCFVDSDLVPNYYDFYFY